MAVKSVIEAVREAIREEMERDPKVFVMGEDVGIRGGVFLATQGLADEFGSHRVIDTRLARASILGFARVASCRGMRPIPAVQLCCLRARGLDMEAATFLLIQGLATEIIDGIVLEGFRAYLETYFETSLPRYSFEGFGRARAFGGPAKRVA